MLTSTSLSVRVLSGANIEAVCYEAQHIANVLRVDITFSFNDIRCIAQPTGRADTLIDEYRAISQARSDGKERWPAIACSARMHD